MNEKYSNNYCKKCHSQLLTYEELYCSLCINAIESEISKYETLHKKGFLRIILDYQLEIEQLKNNIIESSTLELEKQSSFDKGYEEGYLEGYLESEKNSKLCYRCQLVNVESLHHILPRKFGGITVLSNIVGLCFKCHNQVEELTDIQIKQWIRESKDISINTLRQYIITNFPKVEIWKK
jgi:hypothetical protein